MMFRFHITHSEPLVLVLYSKPGCHLCEEARTVLNRLPARFSLRIEEVNIRSDPDLFRRYDIRIPVLAFSDGTEMEGPLHATQVRAKLKAMRRRRG